MTSTESETAAVAAPDRWRLVRPALAVACWLALWQVVALAVGASVLLVGPWQVVVRLVELVPTADFWATVARTFASITLGFGLAALVGVLLAAVSAASPWTRAFVAPLIVTIRSTPVVAFIILLLVWTDVAWLAAVVSFLATLPIIHTTVLSGIGQRDRALAEMAAVFRVPRWRRLLAVDVPGVLPYFATACRTGVGYAWKSGVAAEVIGLPSGTVGERLYQGRLFLQTGDVLAWTVVVVLVAFVCEKLVLAGLGRLGRRLSDGGPP
ncbi:MAG: ABC transporter permease subunit [Cellulomonas sp.]|jgi:NitT/TauT family transport system permease protein|nr:ABC transporter permease subunit [Cellulomonas sp.]